MDLKVIWEMSDKGPAGGPALLSQIRATNPCAACPVRELAICKALPDQDLDIIQNFRTSVRAIPAGADLYIEGEPWRELYTVLEGWLFMYKLLEDGRRQITKILLPGDFVGFEADLEAPMDHSVQTLTEARVCVFPRANVMNLFKEHPELAIRLTQMISRDVAMAHERLTSVGRRSALERVAHFLLELFYRVRLQHPEPVGSTISMPLTQEHIGDALGLTSVHVNRTLRKLQKRGLINIAKRTLHVLDPDRLADVAGFEDEAMARL